MDVLARIVEYHAAERTLGMVAIGAGAAALAAAFVLWRRRPDPLARGLLIPLLLLALGGLAGGPILAAKSTERIEVLSKMYAEDPAKLVEIEAPRMARVNGNWIPLKIGWVSLAAVGVFVIVRIRRPFWTGVSIGVLGLCGVLFVVDSFAEARAERYVQALDAIGD
jgi:hypothetical protein